jgi:exonuclease VII large subunit
MRYTKEKQKEHMAQIRRILVMKPQASIREIKEALLKQRKPLKLDKDYVNKMVNKIRKERVNRLNYYTINKVLAEFQDEVEELKKRLWAIISKPSSTYQEKISAIRELRNSSRDLFDKMFDAGVFERKLGELGVKDKMDEEEKELIKKALHHGRYDVKSNNREPNKEEMGGKD